MSGPVCGGAVRVAAGVVRVRRQPGPAETRGIPCLVRVARVGRVKIVKDFLEGPDQSFRKQGKGMPLLPRTFSITRTTRTTQTHVNSDYIFPGPSYIGCRPTRTMPFGIPSDYGSRPLSLVLTATIHRSKPSSLTTKDKP